MIYEIISEKNGVVYFFAFGISVTGHSFIILSEVFDVPNKPNLRHFASLSAILRAKNFSKKFQKL